MCAWPSPARCRARAGTSTARPSAMAMRALTARILARTDRLAPSEQEHGQQLVAGGEEHREQRADGHDAPRVTALPRRPRSRIAARRRAAPPKPGRTGRSMLDHPEGAAARRALERLPVGEIGHEQKRNELEGVERGVEHHLSENLHGVSYDSICSMRPMASSMSARCPKADRRRYPSPAGPEPTPGRAQDLRLLEQAVEEVPRAHLVRALHPHVGGVLSPRCGRCPAAAGAR